MTLVLLKLSGEALLGNDAHGLNGKAALEVAKRLNELRQHGAGVAVVIGGGNLFRGVNDGSKLSIDRSYADQMGMLATMMNGLALKGALETLGTPVSLFSALDCPKVAPSYTYTDVQNALKRGDVILFVGGTGHPYFTTDTAAALRACEIHADLFLKATMHVDGIYSSDPRKDPSAKKFDTLSYQEALELELGIFDQAALTLCKNAHIPMRVINFQKDSLVEALEKEGIGTLVC